MDNKPHIYDIIKERYSEIIRRKHSAMVQIWPLICGADLLLGKYGDFIVCIFRHTGNSGIRSTGSIQITPAILGSTTIDSTNIDTVRDNIRSNIHLNSLDSILILLSNLLNLDTELYKLLAYHEIIMGVVKMRIFLSHKGADKPMVRDYKNLLATLGFDVWLDEDAMPAGTELHRGLLQGFKDSCAAIFFVTPNYVDQGFLSTEIGYSIDQKMARGSRFSIITLLFERDGSVGQVPELLKPYVWKQPKSDLEAIQEILKALPIKVGSPMYRV